MMRSILRNQPLDSTGRTFAGVRSLPNSLVTTPPGFRLAWLDARKFETIAWHIHQVKLVIPIRISWSLGHEDSRNFTLLADSWYRNQMRQHYGEYLMPLIENVEGLCIRIDWTLIKKS